MAAIARGRVLLVIKFSRCTFLEVFKVKMFLNLIVYQQTKLWGTKSGLICSRCTNELLNET